VLVRPEGAANVGATARVLRNTGLFSLALVQPGDWRTVECWRTAWRAQDVLEKASVYSNLAEALAGCHYVVGFSSKREADHSILDVREVANEVGTLGPRARAALVFGSETSGLTHEEMTLCGRRASIPSHPDQPSLNLSHAVMVAGYEIFRASNPTVRGPSPATHSQKEKVLGLLREGLFAIDALPAANRTGYFGAWRGLFARTDFTRRELRILEHMARKMTQKKAGERRS